KISETPKADIYKISTQEGEKTNQKLSKNEEPKKRLQKKTPKTEQYRPKEKPKEPVKEDSKKESKSTKQPVKAEGKRAEEKSKESIELKGQSTKPAVVSVKLPLQEVLDKPKYDSTQLQSVQAV